jgi:hypothetical protein
VAVERYLLENADRYLLEDGSSFYLLESSATVVEADGSSAGVATSSLAGAALWDGTGTSGYNDADLLQQWGDKSATAYSISQIDSSKRPLVAKNVLNGLPAISWPFPATGLYLEAIGTLIAAQPTTLIVVANEIGGFAGGGRFLDCTAGPRSFFGLENSTSKLDAFAGTELKSASHYENAFHVFSMVFNGASSAGYVDGVQVITGDAGTAGLGTLILGRDPSDTVANRFCGWQFAILAYDSALSGTNRANLEKYFADRCALTVAGGTAVDPSSVSGLKLWLDASSLLNTGTALGVSSKIAASVGSAAGVGRSPNDGTSPFIDEGFEGSGAPSGWSGASSDFDYATLPLVGAQSLRNPSAAVATYDSGNALNHSELWFACQVKMETLPSVIRDLVRFFNGATQLFGVRVNASGTINIRDQSTAKTQTTVAAMVAGTTYSLWLHYRAGSGSDETIEAAFAVAGSRRPSSGDNYVRISDGTATANANKFLLASSAIAYASVWDSVQLAASDIFDPGSAVAVWDGVGSSAGAATDSIIATAIADSVASSAGAATDSIVTGATKQSDASASGAAADSVGGRAIAAAAASSDGVATDSVVGIAIAAAVASSEGAGSASADGEDVGSVITIVSADASAAGTGSSVIVSVGIWNTVASSSGSVSVAAAAVAIRKAVASSAGAGSGTSVASSIRKTRGSSAGASSVHARSSSTKGTVVVAAGSGTSAVIVVAVWNTAGSAASAAAVSGTGDFVGSRAVAIGSSTTDAFAIAFRLAVAFCFGKCRPHFRSGPARETPAPTIIGDPVGSAPRIKPKSGRKIIRRSGFRD